MSGQLRLGIIAGLVLFTSSSCCMAYQSGSRGAAPAAPTGIGSGSPAAQSFGTPSIGSPAISSPTFGSPSFGTPPPSFGPPSFSTPQNIVPAPGVSSFQQSPSFQSAPPVVGGIPEAQFSGQFPNQFGSPSMPIQGGGVSNPVNSPMPQATANGSGSSSITNERLNEIHSCENLVSQRTARATRASHWISWPERIFQDGDWLKWFANTADL